MTGTIFNNPSLHFLDWYKETLDTYVIQGELHQWSGQHEHLVDRLVTDVGHDGLDAWADTADNHGLTEHQVERKHVEKHVGRDRQILVYVYCVFRLD